MACYKYNYYLIFLIFCNVLYAASGKFNIQCDNNSNCSCTPTIEGMFEFHCPEDMPQLIVKVIPDSSKVNIQCLDEINWAEQNMPSIEMGEIHHLSFLQCSLPNNGFLEIMNKLGVNSTKTLRFDYCDDLESTAFSARYLKGLRGLENLILNSNDMIEIDPHAFESLDNLTEIDLKFNKLQLPREVFKNSPNLKLLDLSGNDMTHLPSNIFDNLTELKVLSLWSNKLTEIIENTFRNLRKLEFLELSRNALSDISEKAFEGLVNLKVLSLVGNNLKSIPANLFSTNSALENIYFTRNPELSTLPEGLFSNFTKLSYVFLNECKLTSLPSNLFHGSTHLQNVSFQMNQLRNIPETLFNGLVELKNLDLSNNLIEDISDDLFAVTNDLTVLNLENNLLSNIRRAIFSNVRNLETLNLKNNRINFIDVHSFRRLPNLKEIVLADNYFDLPDNGLTLFNSNLQLEIVDLSNNNITLITEEFIITLVTLQKLDLSYNRIPYLDFADLLTSASPIEIDLSYNMITTVNFTHAELLARSQGNQDARSSNAGNRVVYLDGNPLECDCHLFDLAKYFDRTIDPMVPTLVTLKVDDLNCSSPTDFDGFPVKYLKPNVLTCTLEQMNVRDECPEKCTCGFRSWDRALIVDCMDANLTYVPELVLLNDSFYNQTEVHLQRNSLVSAPRENMGYENVTKLYLSSNIINEINWIPPRIKILELDNNNITSLNDSVLTRLNTTGLTNLTLSRNPWICDCSATNLIGFLVANLGRIDAENIKCRINGKPLVRLNVADICPNYLAIILGLTIGFVLPVLIIAILIALYYRYKQEIKVLLYKYQILLCWVTEKEVDKDKIYDAFISYAHEDEDFVLKELQPVLEHGSPTYKICNHIRDFVVGEFIATQIAKSVAESRRTIVVLSHSFLKSDWGKMEFRTAHQQALREGRTRVILILYGDVKTEELDEELKAYVRTNTYVKWGDRYFWDQLKFAMPHVPVPKGEKKSNKSQNIMVAINEKLEKLDDRLDLIGVPTTPNLGSTPPAINVDPLLLKTNPLNFTPGKPLTPPSAESGLNPLLTTANK